MAEVTSGRPELQATARQFIDELRLTDRQWSCANPWGTPYYTDVEMFTDWMIDLVYRRLDVLEFDRKTAILDECRNLPVPSGIFRIGDYYKFDTPEEHEEAALAGFITDCIYRTLYPERDAVKEVTRALADPYQGRIWRV